jgi:hypothetical protein
MTNTLFLVYYLCVFGVLHFILLLEKQCGVYSACGV